MPRRGQFESLFIRGDKRDGRTMRAAVPVTLNKLKSCKHKKSDGAQKKERNDKKRRKGKGSPADRTCPQRLGKGEHARSKKVNALGFVRLVRSP